MSGLNDAEKSVNCTVQSGKGQAVPHLSSTTAVLATMHQKERAIAPLFAQHLGMTVTVPTDFDTDRFGTFTRDIDRAGTQLDAARLKAKRVLEVTNATVAIASEGAFYPDPMLPLLPCNRELVLLLDREQNIEIVGQAISTKTNFSHTTVASVEDALHFADKARFPSHGLVVMPHANCTDPGAIHKGIVDPEVLVEVVDATLRQSPTQTAHVETDMRAMMNPTRMEAIAAATQSLIQSIQSTCPQCHTPGFSVVERRPGLPCDLCHFPTDLIQVVVYQCQKCQHTQEDWFPNGVKTADPGQCWNCNP